jgi:PAS domain-containing protein
MQPSLYTEVHDTDLRERLHNPETSFALTSWLLSARTAGLPEEAEFIRRLHDWQRSDLMILRPDVRGELTYEFYGSRIAAHAGFDMTGKTVSDFKGVTRDFYLDCYRRVIEERIPLATVHRLGHFNEMPIWERIILPVGHNGCLTAIYVINCARRLGEDIDLIRTRFKNSGLIVLQFVRERNIVTDATIVGANKAARVMTGRRLDEMLGRSMLACFPGVVSEGLWERYLQVAVTRQTESVLVNYARDGVHGVFDVAIAPFQDGVSIDFVFARADAAGAKAA